MIFIERIRYKYYKEFLTMSKYYSINDMDKIIEMANLFKTYHISYFNSLKGYIESLQDMEVISAISYGDEIPEEYQSTVYVELKNKLKEEKDAYDRLKDFKERQKNYQMEYIDGKEQSKEKLDEMQNLYSIVIQNETSRKLLENEMKINVMLADMQKIIGDALKDIIDF